MLGSATPTGVRPRMAKGAFFGDEATFHPRFDFQQLRKLADL